MPSNPCLVHHSTQPMSLQPQLSCNSNVSQTGSPLSAYSHTTALGALPHTPRLHERRQPGALSWVQSGVLWASARHQTGGAWPQGTPRAGGLRRGPGGAALCLTSADIDPRAPISSPMGGARGLLRNPKVEIPRSAPGGSMDLWARLGKHG